MIRCLPIDPFSLYDVQQGKARLQSSKGCRYSFLYINHHLQQLINKIRAFILTRLSPEQIQEQLPKLTEQQIDLLHPKQLAFLPSMIESEQGREQLIELIHKCNHAWGKLFAALGGVNFELREQHRKTRPDAQMVQERMDESYFRSVISNRDYLVKMLQSQRAFFWTSFVGRCNEDKLQFLETLMHHRNTLPDYCRVDDVIVEVFRFLDPQMNAACMQRLAKLCGEHDFKPLNIALLFFVEKDFKEFHIYALEAYQLKKAKGFAFQQFLDFYSSKLTDQQREQIFTKLTTVDLLSLTIDLQGHGICRPMVELLFKKSYAEVEPLLNAIIERERKAKGDYGSLIKIPLYLWYHSVSSTAKINEWNVSLETLKWHLEFYLLDKVGKESVYQFLQSVDFSKSSNRQIIAYLDFISKNLLSTNRSIQDILAETLKRCTRDNFDIEFIQALKQLFPEGDQWKAIWRVPNEEGLLEQQQYFEAVEKICVARDPKTLFPDLAARA